MKHNTYSTTILLYTFSYIFLATSLLTVLYTASLGHQIYKYSFIEQEDVLLLTYKEDYIDISKEDEILYYDQHLIHQDTITQMNHPKYQIHLKDTYILPSEYIGTILYKFPLSPSILQINLFLNFLVIIPMFILFFFIKKYKEKQV